MSLSESSWSLSLGVGFVRRDRESKSCVVSVAGIVRSGSRMEEMASVMRFGILEVLLREDTNALGVALK